MHPARHLMAALLCLSPGCRAPAEAPRATVRTGIDVLEAEGFRTLAGKRVGLITNPTGVTADLRSTVDVLHKAPGVRLAALYGPEHGIRGDIHAGDPVGDSTDPPTGLPVHSLYGKTRKPTPAMLEGIDVLVFDIQDIGARSYTFISTMAVAMEAAAEQGIAFVVLDRPNPLTGNRIEGSPLDLKFKSFVGHLPIPYLHGLTVGELARMTNACGWLAGGARCDLTVVPMRGWKRSMWFDQTGLPWVPTSPHIPHADTAMFYAATGIMGELQVIGEGVGYTLPFEVVGADFIDPFAFAADLNGRRPAGVIFRPLFYKPYYIRDVGTRYGGVQLHITDRDRVDLTGIQFHVMDAVRRMHPDRPLFGTKRDDMFDKVCGTDRIRRMFLEGRNISEILAFWHAGREAFRQARRPYLLYN